MDVVNVSCLFSWRPTTMGSLLRLNSTRNSCRSEIISHSRPGTGPVRSGVVRCRPVRLIVTPVYRCMCRPICVCMPLISKSKPNRLNLNLYQKSRKFCSKFISQITKVKQNGWTLKNIYYRNAYVFWSLEMGQSKNALYRWLLRMLTDNLLSG